MTRAHPTSTLKHGLMTSSPALLHAAWVTAVVAVCLALCTIHSRKSSLSRRRGLRSCGSRESNGSAGGATAGATPAKVSPTPSDTAKTDGGAEWHAAAAARVPDDGTGSGPFTVIDVGTHGPIAPAYLTPDPIPPRRSLSVKHIRFAERLGRIRSMRRGLGEAASEDDDVFVGRRGEAAEDGTLWTKRIILGERLPRIICAVAVDGTLLILT